MMTGFFFLLIKCIYLFKYKFWKYKQMKNLELSTRKTNHRDKYYSVQKHIYN